MDDTTSKLMITPLIFDVNLKMPVRRRGFLLEIGQRKRQAG